MRNVRLVSALTGCVIALAAVEPLHAVCSSGRREMSVQHSDIRLQPGARAYVPIRFMTVSLPIPAGGFPSDCGLWAKAELHGLSVVSGYGLVPPQVKPQGEWAPIGSSASASAASQPWFGARGGALELFSILFDGSAPAGTQGRILLAVNEGGDVNPVMRAIGAINVYVGFPTPTPTWFTVTTTASNVSGSRITLDHPLLNGNGGARLFVAHVLNPPGLIPTFWNHPVMTSYDGARWVIRNADGATMPAGLGFNVRIDPSASQYSTGRPELSRPVQYIEINDPSANGNPYATIAVSPTGWLAVNAHPIAVQYRAPRWRIMNADRAVIPAGVRFNVRVIGFSAYHAASPASRLDDFISNSAGVSVREISVASAPETRLLHFWWQLGNNPTFPMLVTQNLSPMGNNVSPNGKYVGLKYVDGNTPRWSVIYEDESAIPLSSAFNIFAQPQSLVP